MGEEIATQPEDIEGEYTEEYMVLGFVPRTPKEEAEMEDLVTRRAALKFTATHPRYTRDDITDMVISISRKVGNLALYRVKVSYWKKEAEQI